MGKFAALAFALAPLVLATGAAWADTCETFPGSGQFTDQGCDKPYDNTARQNGAPAKAAPAQPSLRDQLRKAMSEGAGGSARSVDGPTAEQLNQPVTDAPAAATSAPPAAPARTDNVSQIGGAVYVCDSAIARASNAACREISADGTQCTAVTLADGAIGWRDSVATPCRDDDMAQRSAFLDGNKDAAAVTREVPAGFAMDADGTAAEIKRLTEAPPPTRVVDAEEKSEWSAAMGVDDDTPPSIEEADAAAPLDLSSMQASSDGGSDSVLDSTTDFINALSSILGAVSARAGSPSAPSVPSVPALRPPTFRSSLPVQDHPAATPPRTHCSDGESSCATTAQ